MHISALGLVANAGKGPELQVQAWDSSLLVLLPSAHLSSSLYFRKHLSWPYLECCQERKPKPTEGQMGPVPSPCLSPRFAKRALLLHA